MFNLKKLNSGKIRIKVLATMLILTLSFANFAILRFTYRTSNGSKYRFNKTRE